MKEVLVTTAEALGPFLPHFHQCLLTSSNILRAALDATAFSSHETFYFERDLAEEDPSLKQIIPYTVLFRGREVFRYQRTTKGGEQRLHHRHSIGVGGHIEFCDEDGRDEHGTSYIRAFWRELEEEVGLRPDDVVENNIVAMLYDPSDKVGEVHLGVVHFVKVRPGRDPKTTDPALSNGYFVHATELANDIDAFEKWSQAIIRGMF
jgi:predicted NUDIX family phosphoesterase